MAKKIKLPLKMANGATVRTLEELKENWDLEKVVLYYYDNGRLLAWLKDYNHHNEAEQVAALNAITDTKELQKRLCNIFAMPFEEEETVDVEAVVEKNKRLAMLRTITAEDMVLKNAEIVALNQEEFDKRLTENKTEIILFNNTFNIPLTVKNVKYIGIGDVTAVIDSDKRVDFAALGITFENVKFDEKYVQIDKMQEVNAVLDAVKSVAKTTFTSAKGGVFSVALGVLSSVIDAANNKKEEINVEKAEEKPTSNAIISQNNEEGEVDKILKAAKNGDPDAMYKLGDYYAFGKGNLKIDTELANYWYKQATAAGEQWYKKILNAANNGDPEAMFNMGQIYEFGKYGKVINVKIADNWYKQAAKKGHKEAENRSNTIKDSVYWTGVKLQREDEFDNDADSLYKKGWCYEHGEGVLNGEKIIKNVIYAEMLYTKAAQKGNQMAAARLRFLKQANSSEEKYHLQSSSRVIEKGKLISRKFKKLEGRVPQLLLFSLEGENSFLVQTFTNIFVEMDCEVNRPTVWSSKLQEVLENSARDAVDNDVHAICYCCTYDEQKIALKSIVEQLSCWGREDIFLIIIGTDIEKDSDYLFEHGAVGVCDLKTNDRLEVVNFCIHILQLLLKRAEEE